MKNNKTAKRIFIAVFILCAMLLSACGDATEYNVKLNAMGTSITLTAYGKKAEGALRNAEQTVIAIDAMSNPDDPTSICYAINHAQGEQVNITGQVADMLICAQQVYEQSEGYYDISIYPLIRRWGFTDGKYYVPTPEEILEDLSVLCMDQLVINKFPTSGTYSVSLPSYGEISFASCARGCAGKYAVDAMEKAGVESGIVSMGGNVQTLGMRPDGSLWNIGISDPKNPSSFFGVVSVGQTAVVTSGSYQRTMPGHPDYHHIFNPNSGYPTTNSLLSATIICEDGTMADCLSTAMYVIGQSKAINYWRTYGGFDMILVNNTGDVICTSGLLERFDLSNSNYTLTFVE